MSVLLDALLRDQARRRAWGEALWTAPDVFAVRAPILFEPPDEHCAIVVRTGFGYETAAQVGARELGAAS